MAHPKRKMRTPRQIRDRINHLWSEVRKTEDGLEVMLLRREINTLVWVLDQEVRDARR